MLARTLKKPDWGLSKLGATKDFKEEETDDFSIQTQSLMGGQSGKNVPPIQNQVGN